MRDPLIGIVGPCAAGKSTLISGLQEHGYRAKHIAQEHSYVADMWQRIGKPDVLVYLDVSHAVSLVRRRTNMTAAEFETQIQRLRHARQHADLYLDTTDLLILDVLKHTLEFLSAQIGHSP